MGLRRYAAEREGRQHERLAQEVDASRHRSLHESAISTKYAAHRCCNAIVSEAQILSQSATASIEDSMCTALNSQMPLDGKTKLATKTVGSRTKFDRYVSLKLGL